MHITYHAEKRLKERLNLKSPKKQQRRASLALKRGTYLFSKNQEGREVRFFCFDGNDYLFDCQDTLITVYRHPKAGRHQPESVPPLEKEISFPGMEY